MNMTGRTILVTFAGRRDRMAILSRYVRAAIARGLIDEWHVWDFTRNAEDARWLRSRFPITQATPNGSLEYFRRPQTLALRDEPVTIHCDVRATNDVHIGLRRVSGIGPSYEIVLGGWGNTAGAIRTFDDEAMIRDVGARESTPPAVAVRAAPGLLPEFGFLDVDVKIGREGLSVCAAPDFELNHIVPIASGEFEVLYRTGYGANGDWRWQDHSRLAERLFVVGHDANFPSDTMFYNRAYQYYNATSAEYADDVILKCDDDIVHFDLDALAAFIALRRREQNFFLISANVVNNGVCAYFQQRQRAIPMELGEFELPNGGFCGSLWSDGKKAEALHRLFLGDSARFRDSASRELIPWAERISVNFIALLGRDLACIPDVMSDDEHELCYGARKRAKKQNAIAMSFVAAHLSFWRQDAAMDIVGLLGRYDELADVVLARDGALRE
jgi:hypothetical protein